MILSSSSSASSLLLLSSANEDFRLVERVSLMLEERGCGDPRVFDDDGVGDDREGDGFVGFIRRGKVLRRLFWCRKASGDRESIPR